jgi:catechol 2,3-dioxygenase-like lactoylglutathione lyase family enzyme
MARFPYLRPTYRHIFFTKYLSLIPIALTASLVPLVLLHESFHALAGRRLGLPSTLSIGRRFYYLVAETRLDSLFSVPKRKRYLPFLAGMIADVVLLSVLTLIAGILHSQGFPSWCAGLCLAIAFTVVIRLLWQFLFYLETDLYFIASHALRCPDLQRATKFYIKTRVFRVLHRAPPQSDADAVWADRDWAYARWYAPLLIIGYGFSLFTLLWAGIPSTIRFAQLLVDRFTGTQSPTGGILDTLTFVVLTGLQWGLFLYVIVRDWRARTRRAATGQTPAEQSPAQPEQSPTQGALT